MANYATLKAAIQDVIKTNGNNEITGALLQQSLLAMINSLGASYQFAGVADESTTPGTPDQNVFYISGAGTFPNFGATVPDGSFGVFAYNGTWHNSSINVETLAERFYCGTKPATILKNAKQILTTGAITNSSAYASSDYLILDGTADVYIKDLFAPSDRLVCAFYTKEKTFISGIAGITGSTPRTGTFPVPAGAYYVVFADMATKLADITPFVGINSTIGLSVLSGQMLDKIENNPEIKTINSIIIDGGVIPFIPGKYWYYDGNVEVAGAAYQYARIFLKAGAKAIITASSSSASAKMLFEVSEDGTTKIPYSGTSVTDFEYTMQADGYLVVNSLLSNTATKLVLKSAIQEISDKTDGVVSSVAKAFRVIRPSDFTETIGLYPWSGFINIENVDEIILDWGRGAGSASKIPIYFYLSEDSPYISGSTVIGDKIFKAAGTYRIKTRIKVPPKYKFIAFQSDLANVSSDYAILIYKTDNANDWRKVQGLCDRAKAINDCFLTSCAEPNLIYDPQAGIVYENYIAGDTFGSDPDKYLGFAKFPIAQPERAQFYRPIQWNVTPVDDGYSVRVRDIMWYWLTQYSVLRCITYGNSHKNETWALRRFDMTTEAAISNFDIIRWADNNAVVAFDSFKAHLIAAGVTPYDGNTHDYSGKTDAEHERWLWASSSHVQESGGYKYFTLNQTNDCPMICRTNDDFQTIECVKAFQIACAYESCLVINGSDWYFVCRGVSGGIWYSQSVDGGVTWSELVSIQNTMGSKPRMVKYGNDVLISIPMSLIDAFGQIIERSDTEIGAARRSVQTIIRGNKNTAINSWKREYVIQSKYGVNYSDILLNGLDVYFAWSTDLAHYWAATAGTDAGKSEILFGRLGNFDNGNFFGDC